jgi:NAD(P)-dependent dehydrogenase (short-subunit alcohol dehydrogenase family)
MTGLTTGFEGKVGLVTGAGGGIGRASALEFARRGASVAVIDLDERAAARTTALIIEEGGKAIAITADIGDGRSVQQAIAQVVGMFGGLDFALNNAAIPSVNRELTDITFEEWDRVVRVNLTGTFLCMKHEIPELRRRGGGSIVNMASNGGLYAIPRAPAYVASKHGVVGLSKVAAVDYAPDKIRVNALCPGPTLTPMYESVAGDPDMMRRQVAITPLGRLADPAEVAAAAVWLCSAEASYVTGIAMSVDGGRRA